MAKVQLKNHRLSRIHASFPKYMHTELIERFRNYLVLLDEAEKCQSPARNDLSEEAVERLNQLSFITNNLQEIDRQFGISIATTKTNSLGEIEHYNATYERDEYLRFTMRLLTESYYYFAFRVRQLLRNKAHPFKGPNTFECAGVRDVRNHLIEHPEGASSMIFNRTFLWTKDSGMHLKTGRQEWESQTFSDAGFVANSNEFNQNLLSKLESACEFLASEISQNGSK